MGCDGCGSEYYDYYVTSATVTGEGEDKNITSVEIKCCNTAPVAYDQEYTIESNGTLWQKQLKAIDLDADIVQYELNSLPGSDQALIYNFDAKTGYFNFDALPKFEGEIKIDWTVYDSCNLSASATLTINVLPLVECDEDDFIICDATLKQLTEQQDTDGIRYKVDELEQVPFALNAKGAPSLRKRCSAYNVTRGIDPMIFGNADDCDFPVDEVVGPSDLVIGSISVEICTTSMPLVECKPLMIGSVEPSFECQSEIVFSSCKPLAFNTSVDFSCDETLAFSDGCKLVSTVSNIFFVCDEKYSFSGCSMLDNDSGDSFLICDSEIRFAEHEEDSGGFVNGVYFGNDGEASLIIGCGINYQNYLIDVIPCFPDGESEGESSGEGE